jgi:hypothetical protein
MPGPAVPPPFDPIGNRPFSFYPPILNIKHNEFLLKMATWSELLVINTKTNEEIWVPRRYMGDVSEVEEPVMILGLTKELEYRSGQIVPHSRRIIEIPKAVNDPYPPLPVSQGANAAPVVGIRLDKGTESNAGRLIVTALVVAALISVLVLSFFRGNSEVSYAPVLQSELGLGPQDDYHAVIRKLGQPVDDHWRADKGEMQYRVLKYANPPISIILMGAERNKAVYIGALDENWRPVATVKLPDGRDTTSTLRALGRF